MNQKDRKFLIDNRQQASRLSSGALSNMLRIVNENFNDGYRADIFCGTCVVELIKYTYERYDKLLENEAGK